MGQMNSSKVGKTISFLRKHYNMTQHELAEKLGVTDKAVSRWENGYGTPDISLLSKLAMTLDIDIESLLEGNLTHWGMLWEGLLFLNYSDDISPTEYMYNIRIVEFQLSFFLLAGITHIAICGNESMILSVKEVVGNGSIWGCDIEYIVAKNISKDADIINELNKKTHLMIVDGLSFVFGKDITKLFRRIIYDEKENTHVISFSRNDCKISFYKKNRFDSMEGINTCVLDRGTIAFNICSRDDLIDAANLLRIIEKHQSEKIGSLYEIACRRGLIYSSEFKL